MGDNESVSSEWESVRDEEANGGSNKRRIVLEFDSGVGVDGVATAAAATEDRDGNNGSSITDSSSISSFVPVSRFDKMSVQQKVEVETTNIQETYGSMGSSASSFVHVSPFFENTSMQSKGRSKPSTNSTSDESSYQYKSAATSHVGDDDSSILSNFEVLSLSSGEVVKRCKRCTFHNDVDAVVCASCDFALVANPNIDMDAQLAMHFSLLEEEDRARLCQNPLYDHACILSQDIKELVHESSPSLQTLPKEELAKLLLEFIQQVWDYPENPKILFAWKCTSHDSLKYTQKSGFNADQPFMNPCTVEVSHSIINAMESFETLEMMRGKPLCTILEDQGVSVEEQRVPGCLCWIVAIVQPADTPNSHLNSCCPPNQTIPIAYFDSSCNYGQLRGEQIHLLDKLRWLIVGEYFGKYVNTALCTNEANNDFKSVQANENEGDPMPSEEEMERVLQKESVYFEELPGIQATEPTSDLKEADDIEDRSLCFQVEGKAFTWDTEHTDADFVLEVEGCNMKTVETVISTQAQHRSLHLDANESNLTSSDGAGYDSNFISSKTSAFNRCTKGVININNYTEEAKGTKSVKMQGHISALAAFRNGIICSIGKVIYLLDEDLVLYKTFKGDGTNVCCIASTISAQRQLIATGDERGGIFLYDLPLDSSAEESDTSRSSMFDTPCYSAIMDLCFLPYSAILDLCFLPSGKSIAATNNCSHCYLFNLADKACLCKLKQGVTHLTTSKFSPGGCSLASLSEKNQYIHFWRLNEKQDVEQKQELAGHQPSFDIMGRNKEYRIRALSFSSCGRYLASCANDRTIRLWDVQKDDIQCTKIINVPAALSSLSFSPDSKLIAGGCGNGIVQVWDLSSTEEALRIFTGVSGSIKSVVWLSDSKSIVSTSWNDFTLQLWEI